MLWWKRGTRLTLDILRKVGGALSADEESRRTGLANERRGMGGDFGRLKMGQGTSSYSKVENYSNICV
jgi:hypothetical protein